MSELDLSALSSEQIKTALNETIEKQLGTSEFETDIQLAGEKGDNFIGIVYRVTCRKTSSESDNDEKSPALKFILKVAPQHSERRESFKSRKAFLREIRVFNVVRSILMKQFNSYNQALNLSRYFVVVADSTGFWSV